MATISEKVQSKTSATPKKIMPDDPERIKMSRDQSILKDRRIAEIDAKLELEKQRLEALQDEEQKKLEEEGQKDNAASETQGTQEEV